MGGGVASPSANRDNNKVDANVDNNQENLEPDNRKELRITELDKKRLGLTSSDVDLAPLSPRLKETGSVGGGVLPVCAFDRNANANAVLLTPAANGSAEEKGAEDREKNEKVVLDKEGDAVMITAFANDDEKRHNVTNIFHRDSGLFGLDVTRTEGDLCEPLSPSTRLGREVWTTTSVAGGTVTSPAPLPTTTESGGGQSLISFNAKGTLERRSGRRMHMSVTGSRWKSQFDDSEGSENETKMKGEQLQSPEHKQDDGEGIGDAKEQDSPTGLQAVAGGVCPSSPNRLLSPTKPLLPRDDPPKCPPPPLLNLKMTNEDATSPAKGTNTTATSQAATAAASTHSSTTTTRSAVVIPPPPQLAPPPPPPDFVPLQHSASAPSMAPAVGASGTATDATGGRSPTTKGMSGFTPPPPPQFAPPPPPVTATLASTAATTTTISRQNNAPLAAPQRPALQHSISSGCVGTSTADSHLHILQEHAARSCRPLAAAREDEESQNEVRQEEDGEEDQQEGEGDEDEEGEGEEEEVEEEEDYQNEYVAAVCRYTTIVNDVPPGIDNENEDEGEKNGSSSTRSGSNRAGDSKGTRSLTSGGGNGGSQATRLRQTLEDTVYRMDRTKKVIRELSVTPNREGSTEDDDLAAAVDHGAGGGSTTTTTGKFSVKLEKGRYFLSHGDTTGTTTTTTHSKDDSSDDAVPHAVFIRFANDYSLQSTEIG